MTITTTGDALLQAILDEPEADDLRLIYADYLKERDLWTPGRVLQAVLDHPEADGPRLLYANCVQDHGEPERAEFIRVQVELADTIAAGGPHAKCRYSCGTSECRRPTLERRANHLMGPGGIVCARCNWHAPLDHDDSSRWEFHRGFLHTVRCPTALWLQHRVELVTRHPLDRVELTDREPLHDERYMAKWQWRVWGHPQSAWAKSDLAEDWVGEHSPLYSDHATREEANAWLSRALIARAKEVARERR